MLLVLLHALAALLLRMWLRMRLLAGLHACMRACLQLPESLDLPLLPRQLGDDGSNTSSSQQQQQQGQQQGQQQQQQGQQQQQQQQRGQQGQQQQQGREVDLDTLAEAVPSRLLVSLLGASASPDAVGAAASVLSWLDAAAAAKNDFLLLFRSQQEFPEVCAVCV